MFVLDGTRWECVCVCVCVLGMTWGKCTNRGGSGATNGQQRLRLGQAREWGGKSTNDHTSTVWLPQQRRANTCTYTCSP